MIKRIKVGTASCGVASGAREVLAFFRERIGDIPVVEVGCIGHCYAEPLVEVETDSGVVRYANVKPEEGFLEKILNLEDFSRLNEDTPRHKRQEFRVTRLAGRIVPTSLEEYREHGGYAALSKALKMEPAAIVEEVKTSKLRGRGGAGFPTGLKWSFLAGKDSTEKVIICNADEGDPGAFMDRMLLESVPHQVLEGMLIGAYATGATSLFIYCRAEYPLALKNFGIAIEQMVGAGLNRLGGRTVEVRIKEGAGAFVCGEETAMIHSLEGRRGTPHFRPPYPTDVGFKGYPTAINNVETFANIPLIINEGGARYALLGTEGSTGTKLFALAGDLAYPGLVEVPMGITIGEIVFDIGGAEPGFVKAVQIGGPSGGCIPAEHFDVPVDYDSLRDLGAIMGSGGLIVIGANRCMVETARYFLDFTARESCGKCTFCRVGNTRMLEALTRITRGGGTEADIDLLEELGPKVIAGSLCGLGQTAPNPVLSTLRFFKDEYLVHVVDRQCSALECSALVDVKLDPETCIECGVCIKKCPVGAVSTDYVIHNELCTRCNTCIELCPVDAIARVKRGEGDG
ncbi:MAG: 4Fe-4S binding protein [bacterium]|nr:4Fe-4S binding protein [bacterium]